MGKVSWAVCAICLLLLAVALHWLFSQPREIVPGVTSRPLGPCSLDWFSERHVLVLSCRRTDMIRFWPLPVKHPWFEEAWPLRDLARCCK
jgi:hypothetical protein